MVLTPHNIGVVGAGMMGAEIALVFALAGKDVKLSDTSQERLDMALQNVASTLEKGTERGFWPSDSFAAALARIHPTVGLTDFKDREFVIEAVFEDELVKSGVFRELEIVCSQDCLFASNTSSISITVLASALSPNRRSRFMGMHFFSPVSRMKLVEVIPGIDTDRQCVETALALCTEAGKTPIQVKDVAGFAVNRLLHAFLIEAIRLAEEGVATPADLDTACRLGLGHPIGPFEMMDLLSNRLVMQVQQVMADAYGDRFRPPPLLKQLVKAGYDGRKAGRGWHVAKGKR